MSDNTGIKPIANARTYLCGALGTIMGTRAALLHGGAVDPIKVLDDIKADIDRALNCLSGQGDRSIQNEEKESL